VRGEEAETFCLLLPFKGLKCVQGECKVWLKSAKQQTTGLANTWAGTAASNRAAL
jgi:hypothetical protein